MSKRQEIESLLDYVEGKWGVRVLYACESGSRVHGHASADSDYDVRFIYARPVNDYLTIGNRRDVIDRMGPLGKNTDIDIVGWDVRKALHLFQKLNVQLSEWLCSPIIYRQQTSFAEKLRDMAIKHYSMQSCARHYFHMAGNNIRDYLSDDRTTVRHKRYLYPIRCLLMILWAEQVGSYPTPLDISRLLVTVSNTDQRAAIEELLHRKVAGDELGTGPRVRELDAFVSTQHARIAETIYGFEKNPAWDGEWVGYPKRDALDHLFRDTIYEAERLVNYGWMEAE